MSSAAPEAGDDQLTALRPAATARPGQATLSGLRNPLVGVLLLIALCSAITGKPLDGFLMLTVAFLLAWDAGRTRMLGPETGSYQAASRRAAPKDGSVRAGGWARRRRPARLVSVLAWVTAAVVYATLVGAFTRFSWPATIAVVALGCLSIAVGWQGPVRRRGALTGRPLRRGWLWAIVLVAGGSWELSSLLQQPHLTTDSYAHPTISALTDPLLASHPGRTVALAGWLLIGWLLAVR